MELIRTIVRSNNEPEFKEVGWLDITTDGIKLKFYINGRWIDIPDTNQFITNTVDNLVNYYKKCETYSRSEIDKKIIDLSTIKLKVVDILPSVGEINIIYLVPKLESNDNNYKDEYIWVENKWELIGSTKVDLSEYATRTELYNIADNEDLVIDSNKLKLSDKLYDLSTFSGIGRKYLRKNIKDGNNILTNDLLPYSNTLYIIQYNYDLQGDSITIPENCILYFNGGKFSNGTLIGNKTYINANEDSFIFDNITFSGTWNTVNIYPEWFGAIGNSITSLGIVEVDSTKSLQNCIQYCKNNKRGCINIRGFYKLTETLYIPNNISIIGNTNVSIYSDLKKNYIPSGFYCDFNNPYSWCIDSDYYMKDTDDRVNYRFNYTVDSSNLLDNTGIVNCRIENIRIVSSKNNLLFGGIRLFNFHNSILNNISIEFTKVGMWLAGGWGTSVSSVRCESLHYGFVIGDMVTKIGFYNCDVTNRTTNADDSIYIPISQEDTLYGYFESNAFPDYYTEGEEDVSKVRIGWLISGCGSCNMVSCIDQRFQVAISSSKSRITLVDMYLESITDGFIYGDYSMYSVGLLSGVGYANNTVSKIGFRIKQGTLNFDRIYTETSDSTLTFNGDGNKFPFFTIKDLDMSYLYYRPYSLDYSINLGSTIKVSGTYADDNRWGKYRAISLKEAIRRINEDKNYKNVSFIEVSDNCTTDEPIIINNRDIYFYGAGGREITLPYMILKGKCNITFYNITLSGTDPNKSLFVLGSEGSNITITMNRGNLNQVSNLGYFVDNYQGSTCNVTINSSFEGGNMYKVITNNCIFSLNNENNTSHYGNSESRPARADSSIHYYDTTLHKIIIKDPDTEKWVDSLGNSADILNAGTFSQKPLSDEVQVGFSYFCTDRQTEEGASQGIMIYYKGDDIWVDALGRTIT